MLGAEILGLVHNWILLSLKEARGYRYHEVSFGGFKMLSLWLPLTTELAGGPQEHKITRRTRADGSLFVLPHWAPAWRLVAQVSSLGHQGASGAKEESWPRIREGWAL